MSQNSRRGKTYKPGYDNAAGGIQVGNIFLKRQDMVDWTRAVNEARSKLFPRRRLLHELYANIILDGHLQSVMVKRTAGVVNKQLRWFVDGQPEQEGKNDVYKSVIKTPWFLRFLEGAMSAVPYGTTVLELVMQAGEVKDVAVVPRANVSPERGLVLTDVYDVDTGIAYRDDPYWSKYLVQVGENDNYGGLMVAAMYVLYKRGGFANWAQFMELFGMPLRKGTYNPYDESARTKLSEALQQMGSASYIVVPEGTDVEFITASGNGTNAGQVYDTSIERCNAEISKLFLGQTLTTEQGKVGTQALGTVHADTQDDITASDMHRIQFLLNHELRPRLVALGYPLENGEFAFYEDDALAPSERITVDVQVAKQVPIADSYWYKTYGIPPPTAAELNVINTRKEQAMQLAPGKEGRTAKPTRSTKSTLEEEAEEDGPQAAIRRRSRQWRSAAYTAQLTELDTYYGLPPSFTAEAPGNGAPAHIWDRIVEAMRSGQVKDGWVDPGLMDWIAGQLTTHVLSGGGGEAGNDSAPQELTPEHQRQIQVFSGFKTYKELKVATDALYNADGSMVPFASFKRRILAIDEAYNVRYLKAEYELAKANRSAINKWNDMQANKEVVPFAEYSTVGDERVRDAHAAMDGVIKHLDDAFWDVWWPPNGWGCRCTVVPALSDAGGKELPPDIVPPKTMFATNAGKNGLLFPKGHPYAEQANQRVRKEVGELAEAAMLNYRSKVSERATKVSMELAEDAAIAFGAVDRVHAVRGMPLFSMVAKVMDFLGTYHEASKLMRINPNGSHKALTMLHELAHHLDYHVFGRGIEYRTLHNPKGKLGRVLAAIKATDAHKQFCAAAKAGEFVVDGRTIRMSQRMTKDFADMKGEDEFFARAYAQYIALRSGDATLQAQVDSILRWKGPDRYRQWSGTDFDGIAKAFDELFKADKWRPLN